MNKPKFGSLFSGGGLVDVGAKAAGFELTFANEYDKKIADVYRLNHGDHMRVGDILDQSPQDYPYVDLLHASPVCTNASNANPDGAEDSLDIATAQKTADFIRYIKPQCFSLENVAGYRHFTAFRRVMDALDDCGYWYDVSVLNSADFGVPQTRRRLFVRAVRNGWVPPLPAPVKWIGWYAAVADIIDTFPTTEFAPWQVARLPEKMKNFIFNENRNSFEWAKAADVIDIGSPYATVVSNKHNPRAFIVGQQKYNDVLGKAFQDEPMLTVTANRNQQQIRAWLENGRVVKVNARGLARFQSVPDSYILPENNSLACKIIGNGVPCLMYQRIAESFRTIL